MGDSINHFFESFMQLSYDNGVVYLNGRDLIAFLIGFFTCLFIVLIVMSFSNKRSR